MLGKLLKYELKAMGRIILPLYLVLILAAGLFAVNIKLNDKTQTLSGFMNILSIITTILFVACVFVVVIVMFFLVVQRFYKNLLGQEGYLMFTLPASTLEHILSKMLSSMIWIVVGILAGTSAGFLMVAIISDLKTFNEFISEIMNNLDALFGSGSLVRQLGMMVLVLILGVLKSLSEIYASMAVGHQFNSHRILFSLLALVAFNVIGTTLSSILGSLGYYSGVFDSLSRIFDADTLQGLYLAQAGMIVLALVQVVFFGLLTWVLLDRKLNLE